MDPIAAAINAVPLQQPQQVQPPARADANAPAPNTVDPATGGTAAETQLTDEQLQRYTAVAASFVQQMYITMWREAQRNSSA